MQHVVYFEYKKCDFKRRKCRLTVEKIQYFIALRMICNLY